MEDTILGQKWGWVIEVKLLYINPALRTLGSDLNI